MKTRFLFIVIISNILLISSCLKEYEDDIFITNAPYLKVSGATLTANGDTAYAPPNIIIKFWLDSLPLPGDNYSFIWNLGDGTTSTDKSPEKKYNEGTYNISVSIMPNTGGGSPINRSIVLVVDNNYTFETTIILLSSSPTGVGTWNYSLALKTSAIYNYNNNSGNPWIYGDFTSWQYININQTTTINNLLYLVYNVNLPNCQQNFTYGKGSYYAYDPNSRYWKVTNPPNEGLFSVWFKNGQISPYSFISLTPGDNGDPINGPNSPTVRTEIIYSNQNDNDSICLYINYGQYANGVNLFLSRMIDNNNWQNLPLSIMGDQYTGWGYIKFKISDIQNGLYFRFGPDLNNPNVFGDMSKSKFYISQDNMLGLRISQAKSSKKSQYFISPIY